MVYRFSSAGKLAFLALLAQTTFAQDNPCIAFGKDFVDGGSYFQNSLSSDPFTFVTDFEGCQNDTAVNILVDPNGDQWECTNTDMTPPDVDQLSTCPELKNQLFSGDWSVLILSNNGNATPIAYERDFSLSVGPQQTTTFTPTVVVPVTSTPVVNATVTTTDTSSTTLPPATVTVPSVTVKPTKTVTPKRVTITTTKTVFTIHKVRPTVSVIKTTQIVTASCKVPPRASTSMKRAVITPTVGPIKSLPTANSAKFRRDLNDKAKFVAERRAYLAAANALAKRAPDAPTITLTDTNTADYITVTSTSIAATSTLTLVSTVLTTATITPAPITTISGKTTAVPVTITAPTPTRSIIKYTVGYTTSTKTYSVTITIVSTTTPAPIATACSSAGGHF